jgi:hypothetical protein
MKIGGAGAGAENPSSGLVTKDYGPGRMHEPRQKNETAACESFRTGSKGLPRAEINHQKSHQKEKISDPNKNTKNIPNLDFFQRKSNMVLTPRRSPPSLPLFDFN